MAGDTPSNHSATLRFLKFSKLLDVYEDSSSNQPPRSLRESFDEFIRLTGAAEEESKNSEYILNVLSKSFASELMFDKALFEGVKRDLEARGVEFVDGTGEDFLVVRSSISGSHAAGFARQARGKKWFTLGKKNENVALSMDDLDSVNRSEIDHVCCLFRLDGNNDWQIQECFSVVELKMNDTSSQSTVVSSKNLLLDDPIVQEIDYVLQTTWPCICRTGLSPHVVDGFLPLAMVAAQRIGKAKSTSRLRWVKGRLRVPHNLGGAFKTEYLGAADFSAGSDADIENTAAVYLETLLFGYQLCYKWFETPDSQVLPSPLSGRDLVFGGVTIDNAEIVGSPLLSAKRSAELGAFVVSQGEFLSVPSLELDAARDWDLHWLIAPQERQGFFHGVAKVCSQTVHNYLLPALNYQNTMLWCMLKSKEEPRMASALSEISKVLVAVHFPSSHSSISLQMDLRDSGVDMCLEKNPGRLADYWSLFTELTNVVLLPLAINGILFVDLRPGSDKVANVLIITEQGKEKLRLIDFESLCRFRDLHGIVDRRYPSRRHSALDFVWQQCCGVAYAWLKKKNHIVFEDALKWIGDAGCPVDRVKGEDEMQKGMQWLDLQVKNSLECAASADSDIAGTAVLTQTDGVETTTGLSVAKRRQTPTSSALNRSFQAIMKGSDRAVKRKYSARVEGRTVARSTADFSGRQRLTASVS